MYIYIVVYAATAFFGLLLGFTFYGTMILMAGIAVSLFSACVWKDVIFANIFSFIAAGLATYFFAAKEH